MSVDDVINLIVTLPAHDQLRVVHAIWDQLPSEIGIELSLEQKLELDRRWAEYQANPDICLTEDEFRNRIRAARGQ